jgi:hypothetical protein
MTGTLSELLESNSPGITNRKLIKTMREDVAAKACPLYLLGH